MSPDDNQPKLDGQAQKAFADLHKYVSVLEAVILELSHRYGLESNEVAMIVEDIDLKYRTAELERESGLEHDDIAQIVEDFNARFAGSTYGGDDGDETYGSGRYVAAFIRRLREIRWSK